MPRVGGSGFCVVCALLVALARMCGPSAGGMSIVVHMWGWLWWRMHAWCAHALAGTRRCVLPCA